MLNGIIGKPRKVIISNGKTTLLKKGKQGVITQLYSLDVQTRKAPTSLDIQTVLKKHSKVFEYIPISHSPIQDLENVIKLNMGSAPSIIIPYKYTYGKNKEMEKMVEAVIGKSTIQAVENHIEHQQEVLQIPTMSKNKMKPHEDQHHYQRNFEESQIIFEPYQIIETMTKQL